MIFRESAFYGFSDKVIDLGDGETLGCIKYEDSAAFCDALAANGFKAEKVFSVGSTDGVFYKSGSGETVYFYRNSGVPFAHAVYGAKLQTAELTTDTELYEDTVFHQLYNDPDTASGMTYLIRMKDGSFIIIDGGYNIDAAGLIKLMRRINPLHNESEPFTVAAWIFTHPHDDHCQLLHRVMDDIIVKRKLDIKTVYADFSSYEMLLERDPEWAPEAERARGYFKELQKGGTEIVKPHTGMCYKIGELSMKVFFTAAEYAVIDAPTVNDASLVFTLQSGGGKRLMILGDLAETSGEMFMNMYSPDDIKADIVQIAHHALNGPDYSLYEAIGAKCCFWMINIRAYKSVASTAELNAKLRASDAFHFFSCFGEAHVKM